ncbi:metallophosphoesterase [Myroides sp. LJL110]
MIFIGLVFFLIVIEFFSFQGIKQLISNKKVLTTYLVASVVLVGYIIWGYSTFNRMSPTNNQALISSSLVLLIYLPKLIMALFIIIEDIVRYLIAGFNWVKYRITQPSLPTEFLPSRRRFISQIALGVAALPFISVLHGIVIGRFKYTVYKTILEFEDLPEAFDGFTFTQLSDIHCGSFDNKEKLVKAIELVNQQNSDMLLFTGDLVNSLATEMDPWYDVFNKLRRHKYGNFSVLGNHDYGTYASWPDQAQQDKNFQDIIAIHPKIGFTLLRNQAVEIKKDGQSIFLVGSENWGARMKFMKYGDLDKASESVSPQDFKILMSHDPSHWEAQILDHPKNFQLTLAGHTHGSQFGIDIPGVLKWSPVQYIYKQWAGLYQKWGKYLYVNRGFGYHAYKGRTGIWPEITVIELRRKM